MDRYEPVLESMDFRLGYADCDPAGIVYYAAYYPIMERTYNEWNLTQGHPTNQLHELWGATHISRASGCAYHVAGELFDPLRCDMRLGKIGTTSVTMVFDIVHRERDELIAEGHIVFVYIDEHRRPTPVPQGFYDAVRSVGVAV